jgi:hypothetical protein
MTVSASPDPGLGLYLDLGRRSPPRPTPELRLSLYSGKRSPPRPTPGLGLYLDLGRQSPPRPTLGLGLYLDLGRRSPPHSTPGLGLLPRLRTTVSASLDPRARTQPRPRRSLRLTRPRARTNHVTGGAIITLPLASSGYGEQDWRPIWLAPVKQVMMAPRVLHDDGGSQPLKEARGRQQGPGSSDSCAPTGLKCSSGGHDIT